jgi:Zn-dependent protease
MHDEERLRQPRTTKTGRSAIGGVLVGLGLLAAKFKAILAVLVSFKWLLVGAKFAWPLASMFVSLWFYALLLGGWKAAVVLVLMILVHELGHFVTWRNYGVRASLPTFIPGFGAFVSAPPTGTPAQNVAAALAGPAYGVAAAVACWAYAATLTGSSHDFWMGCAYIGFFINLFNLIPTPPFDGGAVAGAIDARLWLIGAVLLLAWAIFFAHTAFAFIIVALMLFSAVPRVIGVLRGTIDPRGSGLTGAQRWMTLAAYLAVAGIATAGAAATAMLERSAGT